MDAALQFTVNVSGNDLAYAGIRCLIAPAPAPSGQARDLHLLYL
jgi:hypothetical protein